jgi:hypothetical protein
LRLKAFFYVALLVTGYAVGLLVANRPRFWWQDLFHSAALYWIAPAACAALWLAVCMWTKRRWSWFAALACLAYAFSVGKMIDRVWPYIWFDRWSNSIADSAAVPISGLWVDSWTERDDPSALMNLVTRHSPTIVLVSGAIPDLNSAAVSLQRYPHRVELQAAGADKISFMSQLPLGSSAKLDLGINADVGGLIPLLVGENKTVQIGTLDLKYAKSAVDFERKRVSSRRLSALVRNGVDTRIVVGQFNSTPFSQLVSIYSQQARVRSLRFNAGLFEALSILKYCQTECPAQVFVSRDVRPGQLEEFHLDGREQPALLFKVSVPVN